MTFETKERPLHFAIVCPAYCCESWVEKCLKSIQNQSYKHFYCVFIDALSGDRTYERAKAAVSDDERFHVLQNEKRQYPLANLLQATALSAVSDQDVVVVVDGDDWLKHDRVLENLAALYSDPEVWLSYGSCELVRPTTRKAQFKKHLLGAAQRGSAAPYPTVARQNNWYRYHPGSFLATHLRSYRKFLWDHIRDEDLRDEDGEYFAAAGDVACMWPMMEMATDKHIRYVPEILYVYNNDHGLSENRQSLAWTDTEQYRVNVLLRSRPMQAPLNK
ncbi:MAG: glycosyltransferase family 2 protein [Oceanococcus sp.]